MDFKTLIKDFIFCRGDLHKFINRQYSQKGSTPITFKNYDYIVTSTGVIIRISQDFKTVEDVINDYRFNDIRPDDIVLDIGANIGGFALQIANCCKSVVAYEPILNEELIQNVTLNKFKNITVVEMALGDGLPVCLEYLGIKKTVDTRTFTQIQQQLVLQFGKSCDFLKIDCEGAEWNINPCELSNIRGIEAELHKWNNPRYKEWIEVLSKTHNVDVTYVAGNVYGILHARLKE